MEWWTRGEQLQINKRTRVLSNGGMLRCTGPTAACHCFRTRMGEHRVVLYGLNELPEIQVITISNRVLVEDKSECRHFSV